ncbi:MAG: AmmeMemoRadiSam system protein A [Micromonosporaceae bacterium]|nr:AmmeMemoRadiSam system protein A [Micromonosporaceae bacterium]
MGEPDTRPAPTPAEGAALVRLVLAGIAAYLAEQPPDGRPPEHAVLRALGASFVTLENRGRLRGCVGTLDAARPLYLDALRNARRAMRDPRMPAVSNEDWPDLDLKVSVLTAPERLAVNSRRELVRRLRPGIDGLVLCGGGRRATFLPAVWAKLAEPDRFITALLRKGGWASSGWPPGLLVSRYTSVEFRDHAPRQPTNGGTAIRPEATGTT